MSRERSTTISATLPLHVAKWRSGWSADHGSGRSPLVAPSRGPGQTYRGNVAVRSEDRKGIRSPQATAGEITSAGFTAGA